MNHVQCIDTNELFDKAQKLVVCSPGALTTGNIITVFGMLVLQKMLEQQARDPSNNVASITAITNSIAGLNSSINL